MKFDLRTILALAILYFAFKGYAPNLLPGPTQSVTAVTYVYEKDAGGVPPFIGAGLDRLNRLTPPILATPFEEDTLDSSGEVPDQYKLALRVAQEKGLPSLVVQAGEKVVKVIKDPKPEDMESLP